MFGFNSKVLLALLFCGLASGQALDTSKPITDLRQLRVYSGAASINYQGYANLGVTPALANGNGLSALNGLVLQKNGAGPSITGYSSNGTIASPTNVSWPSVLLQQYAYAYQNADWRLAGLSGFYVDGTPSGSIVKGGWYVYLTDSLGASNAVITASSDKSVTLSGDVDVGEPDYHFETTTGGETAFNDFSKDINFRFESDGNANLLFLDGGTNRVGILNNTPTVALDVTGAITASGTITAAAFSGTSASTTALAMGSAGTSFIVDTTNNRMGVGGAPSTAIEVQSNANANILNNLAFSSSAGPGFQGKKARGTIASPSALSTADVFLRLFGQAYHSTGTPGYVTAADIQFLTDAAESGNTVPGAIQFRTMVSGGSLTERARINSTGEFGIGMTAVRTLDVTGTFGATGAATLGSTLDVSGVVNGTSNLTVGRSTGGTSNGNVQITYSDTQPKIDFRSGAVTTYGMTLFSQVATGANISGITLNEIGDTFTLPLNSSVFTASAYYARSTSQWDLTFGAGTTFIHSPSSLTIATGSVTAKGCYLIIDTEAAASSDDLDAVVIAGVTDGMHLYIRPANDARDVVLRHNIGANGFFNVTAESITLNTIGDTMEYMWNAGLSRWVQISVTAV